MGIADRTIRIMLVFLFMVLYSEGVITGALGWTLLFASIIFLLTSLSAVSPLYWILGIRTCKAKLKA
jgi:hypothetical protein